MTPRRRCSCMKTPHEYSRLAMREALKPISAPGRIRLVAFDLDGTLTRGHTVCEIIGRHMGHLRRVRTLEALCGKRRDRDSIRLPRTELASYYRASTRTRLCSLAVGPRLTHAYPGVDRCRPASEASLGSFEAWAETMGGILKAHRRARGALLEKLAALTPRSAVEFAALPRPPRPVCPLAPPGRRLRPTGTPSAGRGPHRRRPARHRGPTPTALLDVGRTDAPGLRPPDQLQLTPGR
jgi:hypothetical protein